MPREDILAFNVTQDYTNKFISVSGRPCYILPMFLWTPAQRSLSEVHYILPMFFYILHGRFILRPRLTEVGETFTRGGP